jgi:competence protein ComFB
MMKTVSKMIEMTNYMENIVFDMLPRLMDSFDMCKCDRCQADVAAYALNRLPPKYVVTQVGELYSKLVLMHQQFDVDVVTAIAQGANIIMQRPRHD